MSAMSDFNTVLSHVLALTEEATNQVTLTEPGCLGRLSALHEVITFFIEIDSRGTPAESRPCPANFERFWIGHADREIGDLYSKMEDEAEL